MLRASGAPSDQATSEALAFSRLRAADVLSEIGKPDEALAALGEARWVSDRMPHQVPLFRGDLAAALGGWFAVTAEHGTVAEVIFPLHGSSRPCASALYPHEVIEQPADRRDRAS